MDIVVLVALYGIALFKESDCDTALELRTPGISILWSYFGSDKTCTTRFMQKIRYVQIHPSFHATKSAQSTRRKGAIYALCNRYPGVTCIVSLGLEDKYSTPEGNKAARIFARGKPRNVILVSNSTTCPTCRPRYVKYLEAHTDRSTRGFEIASNDGWGVCFKGKRECDISLQQIRKNIAASKGLQIFVVWVGEGQGIFRPADRYIKPWKREPRIRKAHVRKINQVFF